MIYNTALTESNQRLRKDRIEETYEIEQFVGKNSSYRYEHPQRRWEYGLAMKLIKQYTPKNMLNVGGGNSPLSAWAAEHRVHVTEIDPNTPSIRLPGVNYIDLHFPTENLGTYELVVCTSVIEHIPGNNGEDMDFFEALLNHSSDYVFLTTDFHPSGKVLTQGHFRTYNASEMYLMIEIARLKGFSPVGEVDYTYDGPMVNDYTFAALALVKNL